MVEAQKERLKVVLHFASRDPFLEETVRLKPATTFGEGQASGGRRRLNCAGCKPSRWEKWYEGMRGGCLESVVVRPRICEVCQTHVATIEKEILAAPDVQRERSMTRNLQDNQRWRKITKSALV